MKSVLQRMILASAALAVVASVMYLPIVEITGDVNAKLRFCSVFNIRSVNPKLFVWPLTAVILLLEWLLIFVFAACAIWLHKRMRELRQPGARVQP